MTSFPALRSQTGNGRDLAIRQLSPKEHAQLSGGTTNRFLRRGQRYGSFATFKSLSDAWADTTTPHGRLMLTVLGGLAEFERELIIARTGEGRTRAKARGVKFGRPAALTPHQRREAMQRLAKGEAQADVARSFNVSQATISRLAAPSPFEASVVAA